MQIETERHPFMPGPALCTGVDLATANTRIRAHAPERWELPTLVNPSTGADQANPASVQLVDKFRIEREIGRGGQGRVFLAQDQELGRHVALKTTGQIHAPDTDWLRRFHYESRALACMKHPNIVQVYDAFEAQGAPYFAMEYVKGHSLDACIRRKTFSRRRLVEILIKCCHAIESAHPRRHCAS